MGLTTIVDRNAWVDWLERSIARVTSSGDFPPYVHTYPPKGAYRRFDDAERVAAAWANDGSETNLYVHIPYCGMKCSFCSLFATIAGPSDSYDDYVDALLAEATTVRGLLPSERAEVASLYLGGGTPTVFTPAQLERLLQGLRSRFSIRSGAEIAIEAAPDTVSTALTSALRNLGFNRISIGIQSFDDEELLATGRRYGADAGANAVTVALAAGFENVNLDLIYGLPHQTPPVWRANLRAAVDLEPHTITIYPLVLRTKTAFGKMSARNRDAFAGGNAQAELYDIAHEILETAGYRQQTLVTFAREGGGCRHEAQQYAGASTIGLGAGARSYAPDLHYTGDDYLSSGSTRSTLHEYMAVVTSGDLHVTSGVVLTADECRRRRVILGLLSAGVDAIRYERDFGAPPSAHFGAELGALEGLGLLRSDAASYRLSAKGMRYSSVIAQMFFSARNSELGAAYA